MFSKFVGSISAGAPVGSGIYPPGYIYWPNGVLRVSDDALTMQGPISVRDDSDSADFDIPGNLTISLVVDGVLGINTNQFPAKNSQFYNVRLLKDSSATNPDTAEFIEQNTSPALPTGYDISCVLHPGWVTDTTADFMDGYWSVLGDIVRTYYRQAPSITTVLTSGSSVDRTVVDCSGSVPTGRNLLVHLSVAFDITTDAARLFIDANIGTVTAFSNQTQPGRNITDAQTFSLDTLINDSAEITYEQSSGTSNVDIVVSGFTSGMRYNV